MNIYNILFRLDMYGEYAYHLAASKKGKPLLSIFQEDRIVDIECSNEESVHIRLYERTKSNHNESVIGRDKQLFDIIRGLYRQKNYSLLRADNKGISILVTSQTGKQMITTTREGAVDEALCIEKNCAVDSEEELFKMLATQPAPWGGAQLRKIYSHMNKKEEVNQQECKASMRAVPVRNIYDLLDYLEARHIWYEIGHYSLDVITVHIAPSPGERIEVDCSGDGAMTIARFRGHEVVEQSIDELIAEWEHN